MKNTKISITILASAIAISALQGQSPRLGWVRPVEAVLCEGANSPALDFASVQSGSGIVFTSNRGADKGNLYDPTEKMFCTDLWYAERIDFGKYKMPNKLDGKVNTKLHEGTATLATGNQSRMIYAGTNMADCDATTGNARLNLYESLADGNVWQKPASLPLNVAGYAACHPTLSADGQWLVFASDRPGSIGGMDLWASQRQADGTAWSAPLNLGAGVNTTGNELFPFLGPDGNLYFSSNGHNGAGRLDIFASARSNPSDMGSWGVPLNLGEPFNSNQDDFGFFLRGDQHSGWFSSNRADGANDDLWEWRAPARPSLVPLVPGLVRERGGPGLSNQIVILRNKQTGETKRVTTDVLGNFDFANLACDTDYEIVVNPDGPKTERRDFTTRNLCDVADPKVDKIIVEILPARPASVPGFVGTVVEKGSAKPVPNTKIILRNKKTGKEEPLLTDANGQVRVPLLDCDTDYEMVVNPDGPSPERRPLTTRGLCEPGMKPAELREKVEIEGITEGTVIRLDKLYYDYDKANIRPDAAIELDKVVSFMKQYPSMIIELSSHTDSRGSDSYNLSLSQRRASAAREYIVTKGIDPKRITAAGRGETMLVNNCGNGSKCSDPEHERNRRTEIRVVRLSEKGVRFEN